MAKKKLVFKLTINTVLKLGFVAGKGRGACTQYQIWICTSSYTPATIPPAYPDLQHEVCHLAFILTARKSSFYARKSTQAISHESSMVLFLTARVSHTQGDLGYPTKFFTGNLVEFPLSWMVVQTGIFFNKWVYSLFCSLHMQIGALVV